MADADTNETSQEQTVTPPVQGNTADVKAEIEQVKEMLAAMNQSFEAAAKAQQAASAAKPQKIEIPDPTYDPVGYQAYLDSRADQIAARAVARERELNSVVYDLSQKYPEISTDATLKKAITAAQSRLPKEIQGTAAGYKAAILEAVADAGLVPKSKRQAMVDEDLSMGSGRSSSTSGGSTKKGGKVKLSEETLAVAQLLGRDINDPKVLKGLEEAAQRDVWHKWK